MIESVLIEIWSGMFGISEIGLHDDFFKLGGGSLLAAEMIDKIEDRFGLVLSLQTVFETPTIAGLTRLISRSISPEQVKRASSLPVRDGGDRANPIKRLFGFLAKR